MMISCVEGRVSTMVPTSSDDRLQPTDPSVFVVGKKGTACETLSAEITRTNVDTVETVPLIEVEDALDPPAEAVVCLPPDSQADDARDQANSGARPPESLAEVVTAVTNADLDCPVAVVGEDVDAQAVYRAGATDVVPLPPADCTELVVDRITAILNRHDGHGSEDPTHEARQGLLDALSTTFPDYAFVYDRNGRYLDMLTGRRTEDELYAEGELLGRNVKDVLDDETADRILEAIRDALRTGDTRTVEYNLDRTTGTSWYRARVTPLADSYKGRDAAMLVARDITERKRQQERFQAFIEQSTDITTVLDRDGTYQYQSPSSQRVIGYEPGELLGETAFEYIHPDDREHLMETFAEALDHPETTPTVEYRVRHSDGSWRWLESVGNNQFDNPAIEGFVINSRDITDRKERERELQRAERRFDAVFNAPSALVTLLDTDGRIEEISDAAVALVPETREEIHGRPLWNGPWFERDDDLQDQLREVVEGALTGESTRLEATVPLPDQDLVIDTIFEPITDDEGQLRGVLGIARDITERHRNRRMRRQLLESTREMMGSESRDQLAEIVSEAASSVLGHEVNVVYLNAREDEVLSPAAWSDRADDLLGEVPTPAGGGPMTAVNRSGESVIYNDLAGATDGLVDRFGSVESLLALPIGDHGVLAIGGTETGAFTESDIDRYRLLTVSAATAFDRVERTLDLQRYETLFETVQDRVYVLDEERTIELVSDPLAEVVGYGGDELEGEHVSTVVTDETAKEIERLILDLLVTPDEVSSTCEGTLLAHDGSEIPVEIELSVLPYEGAFRGTAGVVRDISERRQREEELRVFQRAITEAGIGLAMYGADGRFEYLNDHYADLLGLSRGDLEGTPIWETTADIDPETFDTHWDSVRADEPEIRETEHVRCDGSTVPVETVTTAVDIDGTRHHILTVQEITDRRERRQQTQALHRIFRHNLRNDLTVVSGHANILAEDLPPEFETNIETIVAKTKNLIDLTETATEARTVLEYDTSREPVDAAGLIRERVVDLREQYNATVEVDLSDKRHVWADLMLEVALEHLLTNAVEHNDSASPRVWVRTSPASDRDDWIAIEVADNGPGVPDIERETLAAGHEGQIQHSVGLGLWIVRWIVSRYGGDLSFHDREPRGTRVRIALPAADEAVEGPPEDPA